MTSTAVYLKSSKFVEQIEVSPDKKTLLRRVILSCMIGNALEWYDFALYGYFATIIASQFFPNTDPFAALMSTFGVFAVGFITRPLGAVLFGHIGDKSGRKKALLWSIYLMAIPTAAIGLLPTYEQVGWLAPVLLTLVRILQGIAMGGEFTGSIVFIVEHAERGKRGFAGSWAPFSLLMGVLAGAAIAASMSFILSPEHLAAWGWRVPFFLSLIGGVVGAYMRRNLTDPEKFEEVKKARRSHSIPFVDLITHHLKPLILVILIDFTVAIGFYLVVTFIVSYLEAFQGLSKSMSLFISTVSMSAFAMTIPFSGWLTDKIGRKPVMMGAALALMLFSYPLFQGFSVQGLWIPLLSHAILGILMGFYFAPIAAVLVEMFPMNIRYSGLSIAHNLSMSIFGGTAPIVAGWLVNVTGDKAIPALYLIVAGGISLIGLYFMKDRYQDELD